MKDNSEVWDIRKRVLHDIVGNNGYDHYGCSDSVTDSLEVLCNTKEEYLEKDYVMMKNGLREYQKMDEKIYYEYGYDEEYISYLKRHLDRLEDAFIVFMK